MKGLDVSVYQKDIDWKLVKKEDIEFAILKIVGKDLSPDNKFEQNYKGCLESGIPVGVYNYSYATTVDKAVTDAKAVLTVLKGRTLQHGVWLDVEDSVQQNLGMRLIDIIIAYQNVITQNGYAFGVYTGLSFYNSYIKPYAKNLTCPFWIARYPSSAEVNLKTEPQEDKKPEIKHELWGWQYTSKGKVNGISGYVDLNILYRPEENNKEEGAIAEDIRNVKQFTIPGDGKNSLSHDFIVNEFRCKDGNPQVFIDVDFVANKLQKVREFFNLPLTIMSGYRTKEYNTKIGGAKNSYHLYGRAFDVKIKNKTPEEVAKFAQTIGIKGIIQYQDFVHLDSREKQYWAKNLNGKIEIVSRF